MKTAIVILNWNTADYLRKFLPGVIASCQGRDAEVVVADSASTDDSLKVLREEFPAVRVIALEANYGFTGGYNRALEQVEAEYFVLMNSDIEVPEDWLDPLVAWMDTHPRCGACGPKLLSWYERDTFEYAGAAGGLLDPMGYPLCRGRILNRLEKDRGQYDTPERVGWITGACLLVRSSLWKALGGLDARFFAHMEEIDLCWRAQLSGWEIQVVPSSKVYHIGGGTLPKSSPWKLELNYRNNLLLLDNNLALTRKAQHPHWRAKKCLRRARMRIFGRKLLDGAAALVYLLTFHPDRFQAVLKAHKAYDKMKTTPSEEEVARQEPVPVRGLTRRTLFRSYLKFVDEKIYEVILRCFFGGKKEHSGDYVTDERRKNNQNRP